MDYKPREGIELVSVCDAFLLIPTRQASEEVPYIVSISSLCAILWKQLSKGKTLDDLVQFISKLTFQPADASREKVESILLPLFEKGFLIVEEDQSNDTE